MIVYVVSMEPPCSSANFLALYLMLRQLVTSPGKRDIRFNVVLGLADNLEVTDELEAFKGGFVLPQGISYNVSDLFSCHFEVQRRDIENWLGGNEVVSRMMNNRGRRV